MDSIVQLVWEKGEVVEGINSDYLRKDFAGAWICREAYETETPYGWRFDYIKSISLGGNDEIENLRPLHWQNYKSKSDNYPKYKTVISSKKNRKYRERKVLG